MILCPSHSTSASLAVESRKDHTQLVKVGFQLLIPQHILFVFMRISPQGFTTFAFNLSNLCYIAYIYHFRVSEADSNSGASSNDAQLVEVGV
jgi:hypothetical protein